MQIHLTRSQASKSKLFGGSETSYSLRLQAKLPDAETQLIKKYAQERYPMKLPADFEELFTEKNLEGPRSVTLQDLTTGIEYTCKYLAEPFCDLPETFMEQYRGIIGRILAREQWGGSDVLTWEP